MVFGSAARTLGPAALLPLVRRRYERRRAALITLTLTLPLTLALTLTKAPWSTSNGLMDMKFEGAQLLQQHHPGPNPDLLLPSCVGLTLWPRVT